MQRVTVHGGPGSGKSTLAVNLGEVTNLPVIHLDRVYWTDNWVLRDKTKAAEDVAAEISNKEWLIEGIYRSSYPLRMEAADTIIFIDLPTWRLLWRVTKRVVQRWGTVRPDMPQGCPERFDWSFMKYTAAYTKPNGIRDRILQAMAQAPADTNKVILKSDREIATYLQSVKATQATLPKS